MTSIYWLIAFLAFVIIEILTLGLTTVWFAIGSLVAFFASLLGANNTIQIILFIVVSGVMLLLTRPIAMKYLNKNREVTNAASLIGKTAIVKEKINNLEGKGQVVIEGQEWTARTESEEDTIDVQTKVIIRKISGVKLIVERVEE